MFDGCKDKYKLRFDFYLPEYNLCIEYQGAQHYCNKMTRNIYGENEERSKELLKSQKRRDKIKREFCKKEKIRLLAIPYTYLNEIEDILQQFLDKPDVLPKLKKPKG
jgi:hypothetical protein